MSGGGGGGGGVYLRETYLLQSLHRTAHSWSIRVASYNRRGFALRACARSGRDHVRLRKLKCLYTSAVYGFVVLQLKEGFEILQKVVERIEKGTLLLA